MENKPFQSPSPRFYTSKNNAKRHGTESVLKHLRKQRFLRRGSFSLDLTVIPASRWTSRTSFEANRHKMQLIPFVIPLCRNAHFSGSC